MKPPTDTHRWSVRPRSVLTASALPPRGRITRGIERSRRRWREAAVVMGGYALARPLHVSGPVAMAVAALVTGNAGVAYAMSDTTRDFLHKLWDLIDDVLNAVLFLLIGLEVVTIPREGGLLMVGLTAIPLALAARALSVLLPLGVIRRGDRHSRVAPVTLIWGVLRGGISVAPRSACRTGRPAA